MATVEEAIRRLTIVADERGVSQTTAKLQQLGAAQEGVAVTAQHQERAHLNAERRLESLQRRLDVRYRQERELAKVTRELNLARDLGLITTDRQNELLALQSARFDRAAASASRLSSAMRFLVGFGTGFATSLLFRLPGAIGDVFSDAGNIVETADKIGLATRELQAFNYAASQTGASAEEAANGIGYFSRQIGEASRGSGDLLKILQANDVALRDASGTLRPLNDLIFDYADLIENAASSQEKSALVTRAFGRSSDELVNVLSGGRSALIGYGMEAERLGIILDEKLLRAGDDLDDRWSALMQSMSASWRRFVLGFADGVSDFNANVSRLVVPPGAGNIGAMTGAMIGDTAPRSTGQLMEALGLNPDGSPRVTRGATIVPPSGRDDSMKGINPTLTLAVDEMDRLNARFEKATSLAGDFASGFVSSLRSGVSATEALKTSLGSLADRLLDMALNQAISSLFGGLLGTIVSPSFGLFARGGAFDGGRALAFANGAAFDRGSVTAFAYGGVVDRPTVFPMARGMGLMGEDGPEAVMPLKRGSDGRLGVAADGGGGGGVTVSVPISISADGADPAQLARLTAEVHGLRSELPRKIVETVRDAQGRRMLD